MSVCEFHVSAYRKRETQSVTMAQVYQQHKIHVTRFTAISGTRERNFFSCYLDIILDIAFTNISYNYNKQLFSSSQL